MRKLERQMNFAVSNKSNWCGSNTQVTFNENTNCSSVRLHGHLIATYDHNIKAIKIDSCGWQSVTTKSRLNAILSELITGARVFQHKFNWYVKYNFATHNFFDGMILVNGEVV